MQTPLFLHTDWSLQATEKNDVMFSNILSTMLSTILKNAYTGTYILANMKWLSQMYNGAIQNQLVYRLT